MMLDDLDGLLWRNGFWLGEKGRVMDAVYPHFIRLFHPNSMNYILINELSRYRFVEGPTEYMKNWMGDWVWKAVGSTSTSVSCHCLMCSWTTWMTEKSSCQAWGLTPSWGRGWRGRTDKGQRGLTKLEELPDGKLVQFNKDMSIWGEQPHAQYRLYVN